MKRLWRSIGVLAVVASVGISPVLGHNLMVEVAALAPGENVGPHSQPGSTVTIRLFQFQPSQLEVKTDTTVTWVNQDDITHPVTSGTPDRPDGRFNYRLSGKGSTFSFTFSEPGTYPYFCSRHQSMQGQIRVL
ncbi:MAG: cupredoxin domain-containing protein [Candidatus Binatia bacterium]